MLFKRIRDTVTFCKFIKKACLVSQKMQTKHEYNFNKKMKLWISTKWEKRSMFCNRHNV